MVKYLVANCADLKGKNGSRNVNKNEIIDFMKKYDFSHYMETSSKTGDNVQNLFLTLTKHLYLVYENVQVVTEGNMPEEISPFDRTRMSGSFQS